MTSTRQPLRAQVMPMSCSSPWVLGLWWLCEIRMPGIDRGGLGRPIEVGGHHQPRPALEDEVLDPVAVAFQRPRDEHPRGPGVGGGQPERLPQGTQAGLAEPLPVVAGLHPVPLPVLPQAGRLHPRPDVPREHPGRLLPSLPVLR